MSALPLLRYIQISIRIVPAGIVRLTPTILAVPSSVTVVSELPGDVPLTALIQVNVDAKRLPDAPLTIAEKVPDRLPLHPCTRRGMYLRNMVRLLAMRSVFPPVNGFAGIVLNQGDAGAGIFQRAPTEWR